MWGGEEEVLQVHGDKKGSSGQSRLECGLDRKLYGRLLTKEGNLRVEKS